MERIPFATPTIINVITGRNSSEPTYCLQNAAIWAGALTSDEVQAEFAQGGVQTTPLPAALPLFASGLGVIGLLARRKKRKAAAALAAA